MAVVQHPDPQTILALIAAVPDDGIIATDCDGTLWRGDVGDDLLQAAIDFPGRFGVSGLDFDGYIARQKVDYDGACLSVCDVLRNITNDDAADALRTTIPTTFAARRYLLDALREAMARGVHVWLVSASPLLAVEVGAELVDFTPTGMIGIELDGDSYLAPWPIGEGKARAWRARDLPQPNLAFGDSKWDLPLLNSATVGAMLVPADDDEYVEKPAFQFV